MARLLLRLLLIASLVMNGVAAPWAMAAMPHEAGHAGHARHESNASATQHAHHGNHASHQADAAPPATGGDGSCCDGPGCQCGCVLPPMLARPASATLAFVWSLPPASEPAVRARVGDAVPPFRPPAA